MIPLKSERSKAKNYAAKKATELSFIHRLGYDVEPESRRRMRGQNACRPTQVRQSYRKIEKTTLLIEPLALELSFQLLPALLVAVNYRYFQGFPSF